MGTMMEAGAPLLYSLRMRIELGRITEIETILFKPGGGGPNNIAAMDQSGKVEDIWLKSIPPAQRLSRQEMIAIADAYFTGLQKNDGKGIGNTGTYPFTNDCHRIENGAPTTNVPKPADADQTPSARSGWTVLPGSRRASTTLFQISTSDGIRWWTLSGASSGHTASSTRARSTKACCRTAPNTSIRGSTGRAASSSAKRS